MKDKITTKNLDDLLDKSKAKLIFLRYKEQLGLSENFDIINIKRMRVLAPETYALLYKLDDDGKIKKYRGNASSIESRLNSYKMISHLKNRHIFSGDLCLQNSVVYDQGYNFLIYENIPGNIFINELNLGLELLIPKIRLCAQWITRLHHEKENIGFKSYQYLFNRPALAERYPEFTNNFENIFNHLISQIKSKEKVLIHGDFQPNNILFNDNKIYVFDFNMVAFDHPMIDIASFTTQLKTMLERFGDINNYETLNKEFLSEYQKNYHLDDQMLNDLKVFQKMNFLSILSSLSAALKFESNPEEDKILRNIYNFIKDLDDKA